MGGFERLSHHPWGITRPPTYLRISGETVSLFNGLSASCVHTRSDIAHCGLCVWVCGWRDNHQTIVQTAGYVGFMHTNGRRAKNVPGVLWLCMPVVMVQGVLCRRMQRCPICRWSPWKMLKILCFLLLNTLRLLSTKGFLRFGLTARTSCLLLGRLTNSLANSLKKCNENYMCWNRKCSDLDVCRLW